MPKPIKESKCSGLRTQYVIKTNKLSYNLSPKSEDTYVLSNVTCEARPGEIMAIAGPSGAGKTSLLEILAGVVPPSRISGHVFVNQRPMNTAQFRRISGYVTQDEALLPLLTVEETLLYSARLRLYGGGVNKPEAKVRELLNELGLEHVANMRIGGESKRGLSGGEKRRVSIGVDLVHDPAVIFLDEPTSGLDSASALNIATLLKSMAQKQGKTIVLTIHQPGFRILELFDKILLLSNGNVLHHGSLNLLEQRLRLAGHFVPRHVNVLEFAIEMTDVLAVDIEQEESYIEQYNGTVETNNARVIKFCYPNPWFKEILILSQRFTKTICRTNQLFAARMIQAAVVGSVLGTIFMNSANDPKKIKIQTQIGFFAFSLTFLLSSTTEGLPTFLQERRILMRETSRGAYRISSYVIANMLVFVPFLLCVAILFTTPVYLLVGLNREITGFLYFTLVVWLVVLMSNSFVACFSALVPDFIIGTSLIAGFIGCFFLFSGYFISKQDIPKYWIFIHYFSLFKYPFECFMINEYGGETGKRRCLQAVEGQCILYGDGFLMKQGMKESAKWNNVVVMLGFIVGYRFLCFLILWNRSHSATR